MKGELPASQTVIILDEIHKYARWRSLVKGFYDTRKTETAFIITGSARLDHYRKGGDSLHGRYHYYCLHPFSLTELNPNPSATDMELLLRFGGFPESLFRGEDKFCRRWRRERTHRVIYDDIRDLERVKEMSPLELLAEELPRRVGSPLSIKNLREADFAVLEEGRPMFAVECKAGEKDINPAIFYFKERVSIPKCYQVDTGTRDYDKKGVRVLPFSVFCRELDIP